MTENKNSHVKRCSDERPCIACFTGMGECLGPYKPSSAEHKTENTNTQPAASAEPVAWLTHSRNGMVRSLLPTRTPDESLMRGDVQQPLYAAPQPDCVAALTAEVERLRGALSQIAEAAVLDQHHIEYSRAILAGTAPAPMTAAARDVLAERARQISAEGWTPEHDDEHGAGQLSAAAAAYTVNACAGTFGRGPAINPPAVWPWSREWWKPSTPRRDLIKAGALILAEIERLDRAARKEAQS